MNIFAFVALVICVAVLIGWFIMSVVDAVRATFDQSVRRIMRDELAKIEEAKIGGINRDPLPFWKNAE